MRTAGRFFLPCREKDVFLHFEKNVRKWIAVFVICLIFTLYQDAEALAEGEGTGCARPQGPARRFRHLIFLYAAEAGHRRCPRLGGVLSARLHDSPNLLTNMMSMVKKIVKSEYEAPQMEIFEARVERGFQVSGNPEPEPVENGTEGLGERSTAMFS